MAGRGLTSPCLLPPPGPAVAHGAPGYSAVGERNKKTRVALDFARTGDVVRWCGVSGLAHRVPAKKKKKKRARCRSGREEEEGWVVWWGGVCKRPCYTVPCAHRMACPLACLRSPLPDQRGVRRGWKRADEGTNLSLVRRVGGGGLVWEDSAGIYVPSSDIISSWRRAD